MKIQYPAIIHTEIQVFGGFIDLRIFADAQNQRSISLTLTPQKPGTERIRFLKIEQGLYQTFVGSHPYILVNQGLSMLFTSNPTKYQNFFK